MKKLTKLLSVFIIAGAVGVGIAGATGCNQNKDSHKHTYTYSDNHDGKTHKTGCTKGDYNKNESHVGTDTCDLCHGAIYDPVSATVTGVTVTAANNATQVAVEATLQLNANVTVTGGAATTVTWSSSDDAKATVSGTGLVTGVAEGQVTITATSTVDNTKSNSITLTVVAKGTVVTPPVTEKSLYETLLEKDNVRVSIDTEAEAGTHLAAYDEETAGIYVNGSSGYDAETHVEYAEESGVKVLKQVTTHPGDEGKPNVYTVINPGPVKGEVEGVFSTKTSHIGGASEFIVFNGDNSVKIGMAKGGVLTCTYNGGEAPVNGVTLAENTYIEVYFKINLTEGKMTLKVNGKTALDDVATGMTVFNYVQLSASNKGQRIHTTKDVVICGDTKTLADSKTDAKAAIAAALATYDKTAYTTNGDDLDAAAAAAVEAVDAAQNFAAVNKAVADCKAALKAVLKDSDIEAARVSALEALKTKYPETSFNISGLTGDDAKYNNVSLRSAKLDEVEEALGSKNTAEEMKEITDAAETYLATVTNSAMLAAKKTEAVAALKAHKTAEELAEFKTTYPTEGAKIDAILADEGEGSAVVKINACTTIAAVNTALNKAKSDIDAIIDDADADPATVISEYQEELEAYGDAKKTEYAAVAGAINQAVTDGKTEIGNAADLEGTDDAKKTAAKKAYDDACDAIDLIVAKHEAKQDVADYGEQVITEQSLTDTDLLAAIRGIDTTVIDNATSTTVSDKAEEVKAAIDLLITKYNAKASVAEHATAKKALIVGRDDVIADIDDVDMSAIDNAADATALEKAVNDVKKAIDRIVSDLLNSYVAVTVSGYDTVVYVNYSSTLTAADVCVTGMNVTAVYTDAEKTTLLPTEGVQLYSATTVYVDIADKAEAVTSVNWKVTDETDIANIASNDLFAITSTGGEAYLAVSAKIGGVDFTKAWHTTNIESKINKNTNPKTEREIHDNKSTPLVIKTKSALSSLKVYLRLSDSKGTGSNRYGTIFASVNGGEYVSIKTAASSADMSVAHEFKNLNAGDVITIYADVDGENGARLFLFGADAVMDTTKVPKLVTVEWLNQDGTVWKTTTHNYLEAITEPDEGSPAGDGAFTGWKYNNADLTADLKLASSDTAYQMTPKFETADITINYTDGTPADEPLSYLSSAQGNELPDPENGDETHLFIGYYLQAGEEPADTDTLFDLSTATAGTYTVYAKYMEANVTIIYKANADDAGETVHLFKKADGSLVTADDEAATLKSAPTAPEDAPEFKGWVYTKDGEEVTLSLATVKAGDTITVTAKFGELSVKDYSFFINDDKDAATKYETVAAGAKFEENALFDITANTAFALYTGTDSGRAKFTPNDGKERAMLNGNVIKMSTDIPYNKNNTAEQNSSQFMTIKANAKIELKVYLALSNDKWGDNSTGNLTYKIKQADGTYKDTSDTEKYPTGYSFASRGVVTVTITLEEGEELELTVGIEKSSRYIYFGGAEATVVKENN